jgi:hypothetical protein
MKNFELRIENGIKKIKITSIFCFVFTTSLFATPSWFGIIKPNNSYEIIGYGEALNLNEAKQNARDEIAKQIKVNIKSEIQTTKESKQNEYTKNTTSTSKQDTSVALSSVEILKNEKDGDTWYVALSYDNRPTTTKLIQKLEGKICKNPPHPYLSKSRFYRQLKAEQLEQNISNCIMPTFDNGVNYIGIGEERVSFDFDDILESVSNGVSVNATKTKLKNNETFHLTIDAPKGYLSIFNIYEGGKVNVVLANKEFKNDSRYRFPEATQEFELSSSIKKEREIEGYFVISSLSKLNISHFGATEFSANESEKYQFDEFLKLLENNKFGSTVITISK